MVTGIYGSFAFYCADGSVQTFRETTRENAAKWARHEVLGGRPLLEYAGQELSGVSLSVRLDTSMSSIPALSIALLRRMLKEPSARALILGGEYFGRYVLDSFSENRRFFNAAGACMVAEVSLKLTEQEPGLF